MNIRHGYTLSSGRAGPVHDGHVQLRAQQAGPGRRKSPVSSHGSGNHRYTGRSSINGPVRRATLACRLVFEELGPKEPGVNLPRHPVSHAHVPMGIRVESTAHPSSHPAALCPSRRWALGLDDAQALRQGPGRTWRSSGKVCIF